MVKTAKSPPIHFVFWRETWNQMTWDGLVQPTGKCCFIRRMEYPAEFQTRIFGWTARVLLTTWHKLPFPFPRDLSQSLRYPCRWLRATNALRTRLGKWRHSEHTHASYPGLFSWQLGASPGGTPLYGLYRYVRSQRVWFFSRFGHK